MSEDLEELLDKVRAEALMRGKEWQKVAEILTDEGNVTDTPDLMPCTKTARPPECRSPSPVPRAKRRVQSPDKNPPKAAPVVTSFGSYGRGFTNVDFSADDIVGMWSDNKPPQPAASTAVPSASVKEQRSRDGQREQHYYRSDSPKAKVSVAAKGNVRRNDNSTEYRAEGPVPARSSSTAEESIELRIDRLLHACSAATGLPLQHALSAAAQDGIPRERPKKGQISTPAQEPRQEARKRTSLREDGRRWTCNTHRTAPVRPPVVKTIWIMGDSFVHLAEERATRCSYGTWLGLPRDKCKVFWFGRTGLHWDEMQTLVEKAARQSPSPDILVIHAGAKDLTSTESLDLISKVTGGIRSWLTRWPGLKVIWSQIIQQGDWCNTNYVAKSRKKVNKGVEKFLKANGGSVVRHEGIDEMIHDYEEILSSSLLGVDTWKFICYFGHWKQYHLFQMDASWVFLFQRPLFGG
ncbi:uncharacterized protein LOC143805312 isoform X2 [Ranitomeya variabilis]|uniref:uncharacterized protein LOC143805312 isoform X2 n=1 Tax=Ranitomeya variabilis TaxID=490064 RepID=UPI0040575C72